MKKIICAVLALALMSGLLLLPGMAETELSFPDVADTRWSYESIMYAAEKGYMNGFNDGTFRPKETLSRAMIVTVLHRLAGEPESSGGTAFTDVSATSWYGKAVAWGSENGIVQGTTSTTFSPSKDVTREQLVTFFARYADFSGKSVDKSISLDGYTDLGEIREYAVPSFKWAAATGLVNGVTATELRPRTSATREQFARILMSYDEIYAGEVSEIEVKNDKTAFTLASADRSAAVSVEGNSLSVASLTTESGRELISAPTGYSLPDKYTLNEKDYAFEWEYKGYADYVGDEGESGYTYVFEDKNLLVSYELTAYTRAEATGPVEFAGALKNRGVDIICTPGAHFSVSLASETIPTVWNFAKESGIAEGCTTYTGQAEGSGIYKTALTDGVSVTASNNIHSGWNVNGDIPMMYIDYGDYGAYFVLEWTNGTLRADGHGGDLELSASLASEDFVTRVPSGETLTMPTVYLSAYEGDVDNGSNTYKHWFLKYKAPDNMTEDENEPYIQEDMQMGLDVTQYGIEMIKWDIGWWQGDGDKGKLEVKNAAYLSVLNGETLREFADRAESLGIKMTLYVLLKDTGYVNIPGIPTSIGKYGHSEWFSNVNIDSLGYNADLGNEECVEFYKEYLYNFFTENNITTWRSDFEPITRSSDKENRHFANGNDVQYWATVGFGDLVDYLIENIDGFRYESCSGGGSMKDAYVATKASVINCDDSADFMSLHMSFYDSSYCFSPAQLQLPINSLTYTEGSKYYMGVGDYTYGLRCAMTGAVMLSTWDTGPTDVDKSYWAYNIGDIYANRLRPLIKYGDLYHILPRPDGVNWDGLQYIDTDSALEYKGVVMLWKPTDAEGDEKTVYLRGLDAETTYTLVFEDRPEQNRTATGRELMEEGLTVAITEDCGSEMIWIK